MQKYHNWYKFILFKKLVKVDVNRHFLATFMPVLVWQAPNNEKMSKWMYMSFVENVMWSSTPKTLFDRNIFWPFDVRKWAGKPKRIIYLTPLGEYQSNSLIYNYKRLSAQYTVIMSARQHKKKVLSNVVRLLPKTKDNEKKKLLGLIRQYKSLKAWLRKKTPPLLLKLPRMERRLLAYAKHKKQLALVYNIIKG